MIDTSSTIFGINPAVFGLLAVWEIIWKGLGMWQAVKNNHRKWFIAMLVINSIGILPIVYLKFFQKK